MEELKEKIANLQVPSSNQPNPKYRLINYNLATEILTLFQNYLEEQLEGLKVMNNKELLSAIPAWVDLGESADHPRESIELLSEKYVAKAQLEDVKKQLRREK